jgi:hypothetical protein
MDFTTSTFSGVIGGLIATFICVVIRLLWVRVIEPWHEERVYKDTHVEGRWRSTCTLEQEVRECVWELKRNGHSVRGSIVELSGTHRGVTYAFRGELRNLILTGGYSSVATHALDRGTLTLIVVDNGMRLIGYMAYYSNKKHMVGSVKYECVKIIDEVGVGSVQANSAESA